MKNNKLGNIKMNEHLDMDSEKIKKIMDIKLAYLNGEISMKEAKLMMRTSVETVTAQEFAICEQYLENYGISDDVIADRVDEILEIFEGLLVSDKVDVPLGHPIRTYMDETQAIREVLAQMKAMLTGKFIKNQWLEIYEKLSEINIHFSRKQNQLYPELERKGFDKPSKVMWTLENNIRDIIKKGKRHLESDEDIEFLELQNEVIELVEDMMIKEEEILYPTSMDLLDETDFIKMRKGDDEIGYCLINTPPLYKEVMKEEKGSNDLVKDLSLLLKKHGILDKGSDDEFDVSQGKLSLEQINLIFKHLQVDLSFVDENEIVKFYSDTKHRVFPRSPGVIGREVQNCHPRESVGTVEEIIRAFKAKEQDEAEFWLEMGGKFIYIHYSAVRDEQGNFRGVLEMMQDVTKIRSLTGSQRLLSWNSKESSKSDRAESIGESIEEPNKYGFTKDTILKDMLSDYPFIKEFLLDLSPNYSKLKNPILFKTMSSVANLEMIAERGNFKTGELIAKITREIDRRKEG